MSGEGPPTLWPAPVTTAWASAGRHVDTPCSPWEQCLCAVPDGDLSKVIREGRADVGTDRIDTFTENGSGRSRSGFCASFVPLPP